MLDVRIRTSDSYGAFSGESSFPWSSYGCKTCRVGEAVSAGPNAGAVSGRDAGSSDAFLAMTLLFGLGPGDSDDPGYSIWYPTSFGSPLPQTLFRTV